MQFGDRFNDEDENMEDIKDVNKPGTGGLKDRFGMGRLSMMMRDLEGLRLGDGMRRSGMMAGLPVGFSPTFTLSNRGSAAS